MGLFSKIGKIFHNIVNDPWPTIGTIAGAALGGPIGAGLGNAAGNFASQGPSNFTKNIGQNLVSAGTASAGTYLANGGISDLLSGTSLGSGINSLSNSAGFGDVFSPAAEGARAATSAAATSAAPSSGFLSGYLPGSGASGAGGGSSGGFFSNLLGGNGANVASDGLQVGKAYDFTNTPWLSDAVSGGVKNPLVDYSAITGTGAGSVASNTGRNFAGTILKAGIPFALQKDNAGGYGALQEAAKQSAANYQPYLDAGNKATSGIASLLYPSDPSTVTATLENTPGYQFIKDQGIKSLDASAASRGMLRSGNQEQEVQKFGSGLAQQIYQQHLEELARQQQLGLAGAGGVGQGNIDAATAYAALKGGRATNLNNMLSGLAAFL